MDDHRWETEALRESQSRRGGRPTVSQARRPASTQTAVWVTLKEASDATGIPVGTLGSWARRGTVDSYLEANGGRKLRIVDLNGVRGRAHELGRPIAPVPLRRVEEDGKKPPSRPYGSDSPRRGEQQGGETDENVMIVPLDAWNKMLNQLGNLHEAGQQLAEARERAAKAETEAAFLRERLTELRNAAPSHPATAEPPSPPSGSDSPQRGEKQAGETEPWMPEPAEPVADEPPPPPRRLWRTLYDGWKSRRR